jgi:parallel beta-helix repeat protein
MKMPPAFLVTSRYVLLIVAAVLGPQSVAAQSEPPLVPLPGIGPQPTIVCPANSVDISPGTSISQVVNSRDGATTFCLRAGVHSVTSAITPKTGNTFVGEFGAILDGTGWTTTDATQAAFRAHNADIDDVTIRNLVIRSMPQKGIHAFKNFAERWTVENNEIASNHTGILFPNSSIIRNNFIHHNVGINPLSATPGERGGGYEGYHPTDVIFEGNEVAFNGPEQKVMESVGVTFRNNFVHHNVGDGIWYDGGNTNAVIADNRVEDNGRNGIFYEAGFGGVIQNNTVRRSANTGVFISTSQNTQIEGNTLEENFRGVTYFINCFSLNEGRGLDLANISAQENTIRLGAVPGALASGFGFSGDCPGSVIAPYRDGAKNLKFFRNTYQVPDAAGSYWFWDGAKGWSQWQAFGHDLEGVITP